MRLGRDSAAGFLQVDDAEQSGAGWDGEDPESFRHPPSSFPACCATLCRALGFPGPQGSLRQQPIHWFRHSVNACLLNGYSLPSPEKKEVSKTWSLPLRNSESGGERHSV